jgi:hypothetical protein
MNQNDPVPATDAIGIIAEADPPQPGAPDPVPTWQRANAHDIWFWVGIGAASVLLLETLVITTWAIGWAA